MRNLKQAPRPHFWTFYKVDDSFKKNQGRYGLPPSPNLNLIEHAFHLLKTKLKGNCPKNKQEVKTAAVEAWQSITRDQTQRLVMSMGSRLQAVIDCKGFNQCPNIYGPNSMNLRRNVPQNEEAKNLIKPFIVFVKVWLPDKTYKSYHSVSNTHLYISVQF